MAERRVQISHNVYLLHCGIMAGARHAPPRIGAQAPARVT